MYGAGVPEPDASNYAASSENLLTGFPECRPRTKVSRVLCMYA